MPPNSSHILRRYGLLDNIEAVSVRPKDFILRSYKDGAMLSRQDMLSYAVDAYGNPYVYIHRAD